MSEVAHSALQALLDREMQKSHTHAVLLGLESKDGRVSFYGAAGDAHPESPYFLASITKLYTTTVINQLVDEGRLDLDALIGRYLPPEQVEGIHVYQGTDYSQYITVAQLVHQTSGLADYFEGRPSGGRSMVDDFKAGRDRAYTLDDVLAMTRALKPKFAPGAKDGTRAAYSDTNFQLLGAIIGVITGKTLAETFQTRIFNRLGLVHTYLFDHNVSREDTAPLLLYVKDQPVHVPQAMTSTGPDGAIVSTTAESVRFLRAFFGGELFDAGHLLPMMAQWNTVFFPIQYGRGLMRCKLPGLLTLFQYSPELLGHSGSTGSFAFYAPKEALFLAGSFNQADSASRPFAFMIRAINQVQKRGVMA